MIDEVESHNDRKENCDPDTRIDSLRTDPIRDYQRCSCELVRCDNSIFQPKSIGAVRKRSKLDAALVANGDLHPAQAKSKCRMTKSNGLICNGIWFR